jgi:hypothetical protein
VKPTSPRFSTARSVPARLDYDRPLDHGSVTPMSKKTKKRKLKARRNKANHGKRPRAGR